MKILETTRLILRQWQESDLEDFYEYAKNPNVGPNAGWKPHDNEEESRNILDSFIKNEDNWAIVYKDNLKVIGSIDLHKDRNRVISNTKMIGYVLSEDYWGQGLATEATLELMKYAFDELNLDIISIKHYQINKRSKRVIEKCGFKYEGTIRMASQIYDGRIFDDVCYSITKDEWLSEYL